MKIYLKYKILKFLEIQGDTKNKKSDKNKTKFIALHNMKSFLTAMVQIKRTSVQSPQNAHCTHLQKTHASPSAKTKNNPKSSSSQTVQKINNNHQATNSKGSQPSSAPSTPKTHASPSTKTENNPKNSSVTSSPINMLKTLKNQNSGLFTQKKVDSPQSNSFIETKHHEVHFSPEKHESPLPPKIKPIISNLSPNTKDTSVKKHDSPPKDKKETNAD